MEARHPPSLDPLPANLVELGRKISTTCAVVGVVGQGYVGFPLAQRIAQCGFPTIGFDTCEAVVQQCRQANRFATYQAVGSVLQLAPCDVIIIAVPTPTKQIDDHREPNLMLVANAVKSVMLNMPDDGQARLLILESTYAPGTTRDVVAPLVAAEQILGGTVMLGYSPERIDPGNQVFGLVNTPKVTAGYTQSSAFLTQHFYSRIVEQVIPASSLEAAEATKLLENTFRFINITFAQEFEEYCERIGLSAREITGLAATKPFGFMPFYAGPGIGGHCIAEDPYYLYQSVLDSDHAAPLLQAAIRNHEERARVIVKRVIPRLGGQPLHGSRILLLGVSYKPGIADARRSPAQPILELLEHEGATIAYYDRHVARFCGRKSIDLDAAMPQEYDLTVLVTAHADIDYRAMIAAGWRILDTNGVISPQREGVMDSTATPLRHRLGKMFRLIRSRTAEVQG